MQLPELFPPNYQFRSPNTAISCEVEFDREQHLYIATSGEGFMGMADTANGAALACFEAWVNQKHGWYDPFVKGRDD